MLLINSILKHLESLNRMQMRKRKAGANLASPHESGMETDIVSKWPNLRFFFLIKR